MTEARQEPTMFAAARARPPERARPNHGGTVVVLLLLACGLALLAGFFLWRSAGEPSASAAPPPTLERPPGTDKSKKEPPELLLVAPDRELRPDQFADALQRFLGREAVLRLLSTTDFPRKAVATLDNLARRHAPVAAWPVIPTDGRFTVEGGAASAAIAGDNASRYRPFVNLVGSMDAGGAVALYRQMYPVLQRAYRELGFSDRSLHTRMFEVINLLLATPDPGESPEMVLTEVKGPFVSSQPWRLYEFADPRFEQLAAGQKILLRVGPENRRVLMAKLEEIRLELLRSSTTATRP